MLASRRLKSSRQAKRGQVVAISRLPSGLGACPASSAGRPVPDGPIFVCRPASQLANSCQMAATRQRVPQARTVEAPRLRQAGSRAPPEVSELWQCHCVSARAFANANVSWFRQQQGSLRPHHSSGAFIGQLGELARWLDGFSPLPRKPADWRVRVASARS